MNRPTKRPANPNFSCGPCSKRPGWSAGALEGAFLGRSHRCPEGRARLMEVIDRSKALLRMPDDWRLGIVPASDTGAVEMVLWSMLGERGVDVVAFESFGAGWMSDILEQLKLEDVRCFTAEYGQLPDLTQVDCDRDVVFTWNGTTSGVRVPDGDWIPLDRQGLTIADATSAAFAIPLPFEKLDVMTWSWQKVLGGEAAHGMLALSPRAARRLETFTPDRPLPKIFRLTQGGKLNEEIFTGSTINTPSMLAVEDALDALRWAEAQGGLDGLIARTQANLAAVTEWVEKTDWVEFLAADEKVRSPTAVTLRIREPRFVALEKQEQAARLKRMVSLLSKEGVAHDIGSYRDAPPGLRLWGGATVEPSDTRALLPWLDWAFQAVRE
ncbi:MAG: phosphoserine transaminase [Planctomycetota bacterium]